ncbi:MAG: hypothetical protein WCO19_02880 [Candidatus Saccharibacteria bacterium]
MNSEQQSGSSHMIAIFALVVVMAIGSIGFVLMNKTKTAEAPTATVATVEKAPATLKSKADVKEAKKAVDAIPVEKDLDASQFDADISALR